MPSRSVCRVAICLKMDFRTAPTEDCGLMLHIMSISYDKSRKPRRPTYFLNTQRYPFHAMSAWLDIVNEDGSWTLIDTSRLGELVNGLPFPQRQYPDLVYFAGGPSRIRALRSILSQNNVTRKGPVGLVRLHLDHRSIHTDYPLLVAESGLDSEQRVGDTAWLRHAAAKHQKYAISDAGPTYRTSLIQEEVKRQLVLPWTRVLCLFLQSISDVKAAQRLLGRQHRDLRIAGQAIRPPLRVIIISTHSLEDGAMDLLDSGGLRSLAEKERATLLDLRSRSSLSDSIAFEPLRVLLRENLEIIHAEDEQISGRFSAVHLNAFWDRSIAVIGPLWKVPSFDLFTQARAGFPKNEMMAECLREFWNGNRLSRDNGIHLEHMVDYVATALLMDAYPPKMHGKPSR